MRFVRISCTSSMTRVVMATWDTKPSEVARKVGVGTKVPKKLSATTKTPALVTEAKTCA